MKIMITKIIMVRKNEGTPTVQKLALNEALYMGHIIWGTAEIVKQVPRTCVSE